MADWLIQHQSPNGGFPLNFDHFHPDPRAYKLKAPWYSAVSQGLGISLLIRAFQKTGEERYLDAAVRALHLFTLKTTEGGLKGEQNGLPWYEETPDPRDPNHILNGHIFALMGIHDIYRATGNLQAWMLWAAGEESLRKNLNEYIIYSAPEDPTLPMPWSVYDLQHKHISMRPNYLTNMYMRIHIRLLRDMAKRTGYAGYDEIANKWEPSLAEYERTHK